MPSYRLTPKYTYKNEYHETELTMKVSAGIAGHTRYNPKSIILSPEWPTYYDDDANLPRRAQREGDQIKVTTMDFHGQIRMPGDILVNPNGSSYAGYANWPWNMKMYMNMRLFAVEFDPEMAISEDDITDWFETTYVSLYQATDNYGDIKTVHEKMLRNTTSWTGKFNILLDRPFKLTTASPSMDVHFTIPINRVCQWQENQLAGEPYSPNIKIFILMPRSSVDVDEETNKYIRNHYESTPRWRVQICGLWKLKFMDL